MASVMIENGMTPSVLEALREAMGKEETAHDESTALYDAATIIGKKVSDIAREVGKPVNVGIHGPGEIIKLSDGTRYEVTPSGYWRKLP